MDQRSWWKRPRCFLRWSSGVRDLSCPLKECLLGRLWGNPFPFKGEKPTVILKRNTIVATRRTVWKLRSKLTTGSARHTNFTISRCRHSRGTKLQCTGPGDFHGAPEASHLGMSIWAFAIGMCRPLEGHSQTPQPSWVRLVFSRSLQGDPRWSRATRGGDPPPGT